MPIRKARYSGPAVSLEGRKKRAAPTTPTSTTSTTSDEDIEINTASINEIDAELNDEDLENIDDELSNIDWWVIYLPQTQFYYNNVIVLGNQIFFGFSE